MLTMHWMLDPNGRLVIVWEDAALTAVALRRVPVASPPRDRRNNRIVDLKRRAVRLDYVQGANAQQRQGTNVRLHLETAA